MRKSTLAVLVSLAAGAATLAGSSPAAADYAYCVQGGEVGYPGDCSYQTYAQCQASASGRNVACGANPRAAVNQQQRPGRVYREY